MEIKRMSAALAVVLGILCGLGTALFFSGRLLSQEENQAVGTARKERDFSFAPAEVPHGEDYAIFWQDAGMEAHIRFLLDCPDGEIFHRDVWEIRGLGIYDYPSAPRDILLEGGEEFTRQTGLENPSLWRYWEKRDFPLIQRLEDLRHFDSLQIFCLFQAGEIDQSGLETCGQLQIVEIEDGR